MESKRSHSLNILETPFSTVTSSGHWFHATRKSINDYVPGLMKVYPFEELIGKAVTWIDSADSLAMILFFALAFAINPWLAAGLSLLFHFVWYQKKSAFVNLPTTPFLKLINHDFFQLLLAAVVLSFMGIWGMYTAVTLGIITFFLYKIGLLRRLWDKLDSDKEGDKLPLNDRTLKMVLIRYAMYQNMPPKEVEKLDRHVQKAVIEYNQKKKKKK
ncbi:MAG: hypothetical protein JJU37_13650 [Balneolaceae bacterium]|nr:hypothetical protein [Balneolaceae bacterium]